MKYFILVISSFFLCINFTFASEKGNGVEREGGVQHTSHPPHDHPSHDHIKKLDEGMPRRKNHKKEMVSHT